MAKVVVCGYMIRHPVPGNIYAFLHYVVGLHRLGHEVLYLEESGWPDSCYHPPTGLYGEDPGPGMLAVASALRRSGADGVRVAYVDRASGRSWGLHRQDIRAALTACDLLLNVGGVCWLEEFTLARRRALVDMDPLFTQTGRFGAEAVELSGTLFSYGTNIGSADCPVPTGGRSWLPTLPPVVIDMWELGPPPADAPFATVANWSAYGSVDHDGVRYGQKDVEFLRLQDLPARVGHPVVLAVAGCGDEPARRMTEGGWALLDARQLIEVDAYRRFIASSLAELSAAKHGYVAARTGWFSDRSVCYLAAGRPVVVQDTGWALDAPGVWTFSDPAEAQAAMEQVVATWPQESRAARSTAEALFAHDVVLPRLLDAAGAAPSAG